MSDLVNLLAHQSIFIIMINSINSTIFLLIHQKRCISVRSKHLWIKIIEGQNCIKSELSFHDAPTGAENCFHCHPNFCVNFTSKQKSFWFRLNFSHLMSWRIMTQFNSCSPNKSFDLVLK